MRKIIMMIIMSALLFMPACAEMFMPQYEASGAAELNDYLDTARELDADFDFNKTAAGLMGGKGEDAADIIRKALSFLLGEIKENIALCMSILVISLCLGIISSFVPETEKIFETAFYVCYTVIFILGVKTLENGMETGKRAMESMSFFMKAAVPVMGGLMAASGGVTGSLLICGSVMGMCTAVAVFTEYLLPLCRISALLCGVNNLTPGFGLKGIGTALQKGVLWCLGIIMVIFGGILAVRGFAAVNLDNVAGKTVKYIAGNAIPIVGGVVSDTIGNVLACGKTVKAAAGGAGLMAMLYISLVPVLKISAMIITYRISLIIISPVADKRIAGIVEDFSLVLKMILSLVICSGIMFIIAAGVMTAA